MTDVSSTTAEWLLEISDLTVGRPDVPAHDLLDRDKGLAGQLRAAASAYVAANRCTPRSCAPDCPLHDIDGGAAACRLAVALATGPSPPSDSPADPRRCAAAYLRALRDAAVVVFHCRRQAHPTGECWFADDATDACADVLAVAHRVTV